jgi:hypothetical protein
MKELGIVGDALLWKLTRYDDGIVYRYTGQDVQK